MTQNDSKQQEKQKQDNQKRRGEPIVDKKLNGINKPST